MIVDPPIIQPIVLMAVVKCAKDSSPPPRRRRRAAEARRRRAARRRTTPPPTPDRAAAADETAAAGGSAARPAAARCGSSVEGVLVQMLADVAAVLTAAAAAFAARAVSSCSTRLPQDVRLPDVDPVGRPALPAAIRMRLAPPPGAAAPPDALGAAGGGRPGCWLTLAPAAPPQAEMVGRAGGRRRGRRVVLCRRRRPLRGARASPPMIGGFGGLDAALRRGRRRRWRRAVGGEARQPAHRRTVAVGSGAALHSKHARLRSSSASRQHPNRRCGAHLQARALADGRGCVRRGGALSPRRRRFAALPTFRSDRPSPTRSSCCRGSSPGNGE